MFIFCFSAKSKAAQNPGAECGSKMTESISQEIPAYRCMELFPKYKTIELRAVPSFSFLSLSLYICMYVCITINLSINYHLLQFSLFFPPRLSRMWWRWEEETFTYK